MPVHFIGQLGSTKRRGSRGRHFDAAVATLAPAINGFRSAGIHDIRKLAGSLNAAGLPAPSGLPLRTARCIAFSCACNSFTLEWALGHSPLPRANGHINPALEDECGFPTPH